MMNAKSKKKGVMVGYFACDSKTIWGYGKTKESCRRDAKFWLYDSSLISRVPKIDDLKFIRLTGKKVTELKSYVDANSGDGAVRMLKKLLAA